MGFFHSIPVPELWECFFFIPFPFPNYGNVFFFYSLPVPKLWEWIFFIPFPFPNCGNGFFPFPSRSRTSRMDFLIPVPVPDLPKVIPAHPCIDCPQRLLLNISCASRELLAIALATLPHRQIYRVDEQGNISHVVDLFRVLFVQWLCKCHAMLFSKSTLVVGYQE